jgi:integrase
MAVKVKERPLGSGIFWVFIDHQKKRKAKKIGRDENLAHEVAKKIEAKLTLGDLDLAKEEKKVPTFKEYAEIWLATYVKPLRRLSTYERYLSMLKNHVYPTLGQRSIDSVRRGDLRDLFLKLHAKGLSKASVALARDVVNGPLSYAVDAELIPVNPTTGVIKALHIERDKREHLDPFTHDEVKLFLGTCRDHFSEYYPFFLCAFRTGMRLGELLALQWGDIDLNGKFIQVQRSYKLGRMSPTKTGRIRRVDMSDQLFESLRSLFTVRKREGLQMGLGEAVELVFHRKGEPIAQNSIRHVFKRILRKAKLRDIRFHDIRHTYASLLLSDGASPVYVKEQMGHSSIQMTVDIYGHWIPSGNRAAVNRLDMPSETPKPPQPDATQTQPPKMQRPQPLRIAALS